MQVVSWRRREYLQILTSWGRGGGRSEYLHFWWRDRHALKMGIGRELTHVARPRFLSFFFKAINGNSIHFFLWLAPTKLGFQASCLFLKPVGAPAESPASGISHPVRSYCNGKKRGRGRAGGLSRFRRGSRFAFGASSSL